MLYVEVVPSTSVTGTPAVVVLIVLHVLLRRAWNQIIMLPEITSTVCFFFSAFKI